MLKLIYGMEIVLMDLLLVVVLHLAKDWEQEGLVVALTHG